MPRRNKQIKSLMASVQAGCKSKRRFDNEQSALKAADNQMLLNMSLKLSVYKCDYCTGWHLTRRVNNTD